MNLSAHSYRQGFYLGADNRPSEGGTRGEEATLPNEASLVHFRHADIANALFVDGSVRALRFEDLVNTKLKHIKLPD